MIKALTIWMVLVGPNGIEPVGLYADANTCWQDALTRGDRDHFAMCVGADEPSEGALAVAIAGGMGYFHEEVE